MKKRWVAGDAEGPRTKHMFVPVHLCMYMGVCVSCACVCVYMYIHTHTCVRCVSL